MRHYALYTALVCLSITQVTHSQSELSERSTKGGTSKVIELTDLNFDKLVVGNQPWMIDVYAPWCPACNDLTLVWESLAEELHPGIRVGKIDGTAEKGLLTRFSVQHYPSIYHINNTETREFNGMRTVKRLTEFARGGWREVQPRTRCSSPVAPCGRLLGKVTRIPAQLKRYYRYLHNDKQYSDLALVAGLLAVPVVLGMSFICLLDFYYSRKPLAPAANHAHHD